MGRMYSPFRYPGGKTAMLGLMGSILRHNDLSRRPYAEPFAGGAGLALGLLYEGHVSEVHLNDVDAAILAFWTCALDRTDEVVSAIERADLSVEGWRGQRSIYLEGDTSDPLRLGFSAFYLNRTNRSGIIKGAGVIGGLAQNGPDKIDCRFNKVELASRIRRFASYRDRIFLYRLDALDFITKVDNLLPARSLLCIDPPYFNKGSSLYTNYYKRADHAALAEVILALRRPWVVTYDDAPAIRALYRERETFHFDVHYSVNVKRQATELLIAGPSVEMPRTVHERRIAA